jgi:hypothetical protein
MHLLEFYILPVFKMKITEKTTCPTPFFQVICRFIFTVSKCGTGCSSDQKSTNYSESPLQGEFRPIINDADMD